jgi:hypothetical protein
MRTMTLFVVEQTGYGHVVRVPVSLPYVAGMVDGVKYLEPADVRPPEGGTEAYRHRAPRVSLRRLVLLALARDAEQQDRKLRSRLAAAEWRQRQQAARDGRDRAEAKLAERLDGLLDPVK